MTSLTSRVVRSRQGTDQDWSQIDTSHPKDDNSLPNQYSHSGDMSFRSSRPQSLYPISKIARRSQSWLIKVPVWFLHRARIKRLTIEAQTQRSVQHIWTWRLDEAAEVQMLSNASPSLFVSVGRNRMFCRTASLAWPGMPTFADLVQITVRHNCYNLVCPRS